MSFKILFNDWIRNKTNSQLETIDEICSLLDISANLWFANYFEKNDFTGMNFLHEMKENFVFYVSCEFQKKLLKYIKPSGYNIYREPYLSIDLDLDYIRGVGFTVISKKGFNKFSKQLTLDQKIDLMNNKLFSTIVLQTKLKIYSKKDIRVLKLRNLNEYCRFVDSGELSEKGSI